MKRGLMVMVCLVFFVSFVSATNYYVSPAGSASWASCTNINTPCSLSTANSNAVADDVVYLRGGTYSTSLNPTNSGSAGHVITFKSYTGEQAYLENTNIAIDLTSGQSYIVLDTLYSGNNNKERLLVATNGLYNEVKNCHFTERTTVTTYSFSNLEYCQYWNIHDNIFDYAGPYPGDGWSDYTGTMLMLFRSHYNYIHDNTFINGADHDYFDLAQSNFNIVKNNVFYNDGSHISWYDQNHDATINGPNEMFCVEETSSYNLLEGNKFHEEGNQIGDTGGCGYHLESASANILRRGVFYDVDGFAIDIYAPGKNAWNNRFYFNTIYNLQHYPRYGDGWHGPIVLLKFSTVYSIQYNIFKNNILSECGNGLSEGDSDNYNTILNNLFQGNWLYDTTGSEVQRYIDGTGMQTKTLAEAHDLWPDEFSDNTAGTDPKFTDPTGTPRDFTLQGTSPCINTGLWLTFISSANGNSQTFTVDDPYYFSVGIPQLSISGDTIETQSGQKAVITNIDYANKRITVDHSVSWAHGEGLALDYSGSAPDLGAIEYTATGTCTENWQCTSWSAWSLCVNNLQTRTRTCTDMNSCGTTTSKPSESETQACSSSTNTYTILKSSSPPTIDGILNEFANANSLTITNSNGNSATYKMLWDSNNLYIAAQGSDSQLAAIASERDGALWDDDAIELFFDTLNNGGIFLNSDDYKFFVNLLNTTRDSYFGGGGSSWNTIFNSAVTTSGTLNVAGNVDAGYTIEIAIPWSNWGVSVPVDSSVWGFDVSMDDRNDAGDVIQKAWSQTNVGNIPDEFGDVTFSSQFVSSGSVCKSLADSNSDGVISISELINYISQWKSGSVSITQLIDAIGKWKSGC